jgi:hypothetical protein
MNVYHAVAVARANLPRLTLAQRVVDKIVRNALVYETETGESLVGCAVRALGRPEPDLYVLETISPDESAIRSGAYFEQGDDLQGDIFNWWFDNWAPVRERRRKSYGSAFGAKWDVPLAHLGDWHKHPGSLVEPSWGDTDTARHQIFDETLNAPQLLAILATVWDRQFAESADADDVDLTQGQPLKVPVDAANLIRIDCWYISRLTRRFVRLTPQVVPDDTLPNLPIIAWHLLQPERMRQEIEALSREGYTVSVDQYDVDDTPPLEVCLTLAKRSSPHILIVATEADYPASRPTIHSVPMSVMKEIPQENLDSDLFVNLWKQSKPLPKSDYPTWDWTPDRTILDLVRAVEARLTERSATP